MIWQTVTDVMPDRSETSEFLMLRSLSRRVEKDEVIALEHMHC